MTFVQWDRLLVPVREVLGRMKLRGEIGGELTSSPITRTFQLSDRRGNILGGPGVYLLGGPS